MAVKKKIKKTVNPQFSFACDTELKDAFVETCKDMDTSAARELRAYMRKYIAKHGQESLF